MHMIDWSIGARLRTDGQEIALWCNYLSSSACTDTCNLQHKVKSVVNDTVDNLVFVDDHTTGLNHRRRKYVMLSDEARRLCDHDEPNLDAATLMDDDNGLHVSQKHPRALCWVRQATILALKHTWQLTWRSADTFQVKCLETTRRSHPSYSLSPRRNQCLAILSNECPSKIKLPNRFKLYELRQPNWNGGLQQLWDCVQQLVSSQSNGSRKHERYKWYHICQPRAW